jgi:hypothetical protein
MLVVYVKETAAPVGIVHKFPTAHIATMLAASAIFRLPLWAAWTVRTSLTVERFEMLATSVVATILHVWTAKEYPMEERSMMPVVSVEETTTAVRR